MRLDMKRIGGALLAPQGEQHSNAEHQQKLAKSVREKRKVVRDGWGAERALRRLSIWA